jgi:hypothetical protein
MDGHAVIVNADDLGISDAVNEATFDLIARGRISSATIMANGPSVHDAAKVARHFSGCSFGVHLNLTQFEPLTGGVLARLLVDERGRMSRANERASPSRQGLRAAYEEFCAQLERVAAFGIDVTHVDSHNHVHTIPALFPVLKEVQRRYGIRRVRLTKNMYGSDRPCTPALIWKKRAYNWALRWIYRTRTTDAFTEFLTYVNAGPVTRSSAGLVELMVHPGAPSTGEEAAALESDWIARAGFPLQMIPYTRLS